MRKTFEIPLDIPDVTIEKVETDRYGDFVITVKSTVEGTHCHTCGMKITKVYGYDHEITLRHLSILGRKTSIRLRPGRYNVFIVMGHRRQRSSYRGILREAPIRRLMKSIYCWE